MGNNRRGTFLVLRIQNIYEQKHSSLYCKPTARLSALFCSAATLSLVQLHALTHSTARPSVHTHYVFIPLYVRDRDDICHQSFPCVSGVVSLTNLTEYSHLFFPSGGKMKNVNNSTLRAQEHNLTTETSRNQCYSSKIQAWALSTGCWYQGTFSNVSHQWLLSWQRWQRQLKVWQQRHLQGRISQHRIHKVVSFSEVVPSRRTEEEPS